MKKTLILLLAMTFGTVHNFWADTEIYVSPEGNDKASGSFHKPLKTIDAALQKINSIDRESVTIILRQGVYELDSTLVVGRKGNFRSLTICPYEHEEVRISGGRKIPLAQVKKIRDAKINERLQSPMRGVVRELDLGKLNIPMTDLRASGFGRPSSPAWTELFADDAPLNLSRWPNDSTVRIGKILEPGNGEYVESEKFPVFQYYEDRPAAWNKAGSFWISGYFAHGYASDQIRVDHIDPATKTIYTAQQTVYGFMTGADWRRWYAVNLLEELDRPGEYVLDKEREKIYVYLPEGTKSLNVSVLGEPLMAIENCAHVTVRGITFEYGRSMGIYLENTQHVRIQDCIVRNMGGVGISVGMGSETPDKTVLKPHAAEAGGLPKSRVVGDLQGKIYQDVLFNRNGGQDNGIINCRLYQLGSGGISLGGGDRKTLTPAGNFVQNCLIHDFNRVEKSYRPGVWIDGVGNRVSQCNIYNAPSMAILFHGNNHIIEYCKITNVCSEVDDQGAIYYGRDPSELGHVIRYCYFYKLSPRHRVTATYHDDGACGAEVYGNIYHHAGSLPVLIGGGHYNRYHHNIFIDSPTAIHLDNRMQNWGTGMVAPNGIIDQRLRAVDHKNPPYSTAYPFLARYWDENPAYPHGNVIEGNLFYRIQNVVHGQTQWAEFWNNWITDKDPGFVDPKQPLKGFRKDAPIYKMIAGFPELPFEKIGCTLEE